MNSLRILIVVGSFLLSVVSVSAQSLVGKSWDFQYGDSAFTGPYVDVDEWRDQPVRHHYIHGGFKSNGPRFSFYFPAKEDYDGRFFQYITPMPDNEFIVPAWDRLQRHQRPLLRENLWGLMSSRLTISSIGKKQAARRPLWMLF